MFNKLFVLIVVSFIGIKASAWSGVGHQIICDIAWKESSSKIKAQLSKAADRMGYSSFASLCVWADHVRSDSSYDFLKPMHFVNAPKGASSIKVSRDCATKSSWFQRSDALPNCVVTAIRYYSDRLQNDSLPQGDRDEALALVGHFIGDIHQPLHVDIKPNRGGTRTPITLKGRSHSLHQYWDKQVIGCGDYVRWRQLATDIRNSHNARFSNTSKPLDWANESLKLSGAIYNRLNRRISQRACEVDQDLAYRQLHKAGVRLSYWLSTKL